MFWRELSVIEIIGLAAAAVALIGMILALLTAKGREAFALLGVRVAEALIGWLVRFLSPDQQQAWANTAQVRAERYMRGPQ
jgi:hypothetical protein